MPVNVATINHYQAFYRQGAMTISITTLGITAFNITAVGVAIKSVAVSKDTLHMVSLC